jgi:hypothetical protein
LLLVDVVIRYLHWPRIEEYYITCHTSKTHLLCVKSYRQYMAIIKSRLV